MTKDAASAVEPSYDLGYERCIATFLDILGFRSLLKKRQASDIREVMRRLRAFSVGAGTRDNPPRRMKDARLDSQTYSESISDAIVRVRTLDTQFQDGAFLAELRDLVKIQVECIRHGFLVRGGMAIGPVHVGLDGTGPIFGDGMVRAYEIEDKEAVYPRIMIDDDAVASFMSDESLWLDGHLPENPEIIGGNYISVGEDGASFIDYISASRSDVFADDAEFIDFLTCHAKLIRSYEKGNDPKVRRKFIWLSNYHNMAVDKLRDEFRERKMRGDPTAAYSPSRLHEALHIPGCQPARKFDPLSAPNIDPLFVSVGGYPGSP